MNFECGSIHRHGDNLGALSIFLASPLPEFFDLPPRDHLSRLVQYYDFMKRILCLLKIAIESTLLPAVLSNAPFSVECPINGM